jgi:hypothetical protein
MGVVKLSKSEITDYQKYSNMLAGNDAYVPTFPAYDLIQTVVPTGSASTLTFSSIPQTYKHLQIRMAARSTSSVIDHWLFLRINGDSSSNYTYGQMKGNGINSSANNASTSSNTSTSIGIQFTDIRIAGASSGSNIHTPYVIDFVDYTTSTFKTVRGVGGTFVQTSNNTNIMMFSGTRLSAQAITSITLGLGDGVGNWTATSRFSLYGIRG